MGRLTNLVHITEGKITCVPTPKNGTCPVSAIDTLCDCGEEYTGPAPNIGDQDVQGPNSSQVLLYNANRRPKELRMTLLRKRRGVQSFYSSYKKNEGKQSNSSCDSQIYYHAG